MHGGLGNGEQGGFVGFRRDAEILRRLHEVVNGFAYAQNKMPMPMPEHSELIDGDPGLGVYWESKNSFIRNDARTILAGPVQFVYPARSSLEAEQAA